MELKLFSGRKWDDSFNETNMESIKLYLSENVIRQFNEILKNIKDMPPEFSRTVNENFWDLI